MCLSLFGFTDLLSSTLSWKTIFLAAVSSLILNGFLVRVWLHRGTFYKSGLYPSAFYQVIFILMIGIVVIGAADKVCGGCLGWSVSIRDAIARIFDSRINFDVDGEGE